MDRDIGGVGTEQGLWFILAANILLWLFCSLILNSNSPVRSSMTVFSTWPSAATRRKSVCVCVCVCVTRGKIEACVSVYVRDAPLRRLAVAGESRLKPHTQQNSTMTNSVKGLGEDEGGRADDRRAGDGGERGDVERMRERGEGERGGEEDQREKRERE